MKKPGTIYPAKGGAHRSAAKKGWTIVELVMVIIIMAILTGFVARVVVRKSAATNYSRARTEIRAIESALDAYKFDYGCYPLSKAFGSPPPYVLTGDANFANPTLPQDAGWMTTPTYLRVTSTAPIPYTLADDTKGYVSKNAASLWYYLYKAPTNIGKAPYITFTPKQLAVYGSYQMVIDPWGHPYNYDAYSAANATPYRRNQATFDLFSAGPNGIYEDSDDVNNWEAH